MSFATLYDPGEESRRRVRGAGSPRVETILELHREKRTAGLGPIAVASLKVIAHLDVPSPAARHLETCGEIAERIRECNQGP